MCCSVSVKCALSLSVKCVALRLGGGFIATRMQKALPHTAGGSMTLLQFLHFDLSLYRLLSVNDNFFCH